MAGTLGSISGNIVISGKQAIAEYAAVRAANAATVDSLKGASQTFAKVGTLALGAGGAIAALFAVAVDQAAQFEKKIDYFGAVSGATRADMDLIAAKAISMSKTTIFSADQMADAMVDFGKAGLTTSQILGGVADATADLAQAAGMNISDASNIIVSAMDTFHISASNSIDIANELAGAANASIIDVSDLATSLKYAGGVAEAAGIPMNSVVTALALLGNAGIKGSQGGTILRQVMVSLTAPTKAASAELTKLGIEGKNGMNLLIDSSGKLKPLDQIFQILKTHTEGLTQAQTLAATKIIFNSRALAGANILMQDGAAGFATMNAQIANTSAADVASKRLNNLAGDTTKFKNAVQTALIEAGGPLQNMLRGIVQWATRLVDAWGNLSPSTQETTLKILAGVAAFLLAVGALSMFVAVILRVIILGKQIYQVFVLIKAGIMLLRDGFIMLQLVMEANPLILIITIAIVVIAALVLMYMKFKWFRDFVNAVFHDVVNWAEWFWHHVTDIFETVLHWIENHWRLLVSIIGGPLAAVVILVTDHFNAIKSFIMGIIHDVINFFQTVWGGIKDYILNPIVDAWDAVSNAFQTAYNTIVKIVKAILDWFTPSHWRILALALGPIGIAIDIVTNHLTFFKNLAMTIFNALEKFFKVIWGQISSIFITAGKLIWNIISTDWNLIYSVIKFVWNLIVQFFTIQWNIIHSIFSFALNLIITVWTDTWNSLRDTAIAVWNGIIAFLTPIVNSVRDIISGAINSAKAIWDAVWADIKRVITDAYNATINPITAAIHVAIKFVQDSISSLRNIWNLVWADIKQVVTDVWNFLEPIFKKIKQGLDDTVGAVSKVAGGIKGGLSKAGSFLGLASGGFVPGRNGELADNVRVHGGEYVLSTDMLSGRQAIAPQVLSALAASQMANTQSMNALLSLSNAAGSNSGSVMSTVSRGATRSATNSTDHSISIGAVQNYYPKPETPSDSATRTVRKIAYLHGGPR